MTLTGAVQSPVFTLVDANGNVLSTPSLTSVGTPSIQPLTFAGSITVPTVAVHVRGIWYDCRRASLFGSVAFTLRAKEYVD